MDQFSEVFQIFPHFALKSREREVKLPCFYYMWWALYLYLLFRFLFQQIIFVPLFRIYFNRSYLYPIRIYFNGPYLHSFFVSISMHQICTPFSYLFQQVKFVSHFRIYFNGPYLYLFSYLLQIDYFWLHAVPVISLYFDITFLLNCEIYPLLNHLF